MNKEKKCTIEEILGLLPKDKDYAILSFDEYLQSIISETQGRKLTLSDFKRTMVATSSSDSLAESESPKHRCTMA